jgi:hypothetical protein
MAIEKVPLPAIARSAFALLSRQAEAAVERIGGETLGAMALAPELGWRVDFAAGVAVREVPDAPAADGHVAEIAAGDAP